MFGERTVLVRDVMQREVAVIGPDASLRARGSHHA